MSKIDQLCVITDEISQDFEHALDVAAEHGVKAVDVRMIWNKNIALFSNEELQRLKEALDKRNMKVIAITGPFAKCFLPNARLSRKKGKSFMFNPTYNLSLFDRIVEISDFFKTPYIRVFSFVRSLLGKPVNQKQWDEMKSLFEPYIKKAESLGKIFLVENDLGMHVGKIKDTKRFFEEIKSDSVKLLLDPGNFWMEKEEIVPEAFEWFYEQDLVAHQHIKDPIGRYLGKIAGKFGVVGGGEIDYKALFKQAIDYGFKGYFSLETHAGKNKEEISRKSLENMTNWLKEL
jgi:L-ribulose-5-phosphate 3-epimerase